MATVTNTITLPDGSAPTYASVEIELVASTSGAAPGWVTATDDTILSKTTLTVTTGEWSADLTPNDDIDPSGTVYRVTETVGGKRYVHYIDVPSGGGALHDLLTSSPTVGDLAFTSLTDHNNSATAHEGELQPYDADLAAIAALSTQSFGRSLLTQTSAATTRVAVQAQRAISEDIRDHGAVGGGADDSAAFIAAVAATGWPSNPGRLIIPDGQSWRIASTVSLNGAGATSTPAFEVTGGRVYTTTTNLTMFEVTNSTVSTTYVTFRRMTLFHNASGSVGILINNAEATTLADLSLSGSSGTSVKITGTSTYNKIIGCSFFNSKRGLHINGGASYLRIIGCSFGEQLSGSPLNWIEADDGSLPATQVSIHGCTFYGDNATLPLIRIQYGNGWQIVGNDFYHTQTGGVWVGRDGSSRNHVISSNTFSNGIGDDVTIDGGRGCVVIGNSFISRQSGSGVDSAIRVKNTFGGSAGFDTLVVANTCNDSGLAYFINADSACAPSMVAQLNRSVVGDSPAYAQRGAVVSSLPTAAAGYRGQTRIKSGIGTEDKVCVCVLSSDGSTYKWIDVKDGSTVT